MVNGIQERKPKDTCLALLGCWIKLQLCIVSVFVKHFRYSLLDFPTAYISLKTLPPSPTKQPLLVLPQSPLPSIAAQGLLNLVFSWGRAVR